MTVYHSILLRFVMFEYSLCSRGPPLKDETIVENPGDDFFFVRLLRKIYACDLVSLDF